MSINHALIAELKHEASLTQKMLERVPMDKKDWRPHEKSMSLGRLATHVTETIKWISNIHQFGEFDFLRDFNFKQQVAVSNEELLQLFQNNLDAAITDLSAMSDEEMNKQWTVRRGEQVMMQLPKKVGVRGWALSHHIHHRGQLSVYLRLLDVPVPGMYGPSADER